MADFGSRIGLLGVLRDDRPAEVRKLISMNAIISSSACLSSILEFPGIVLHDRI
jgi:hypothetical protein